jgi:Flp pilus assembly protein TadD
MRTVALTGLQATGSGSAQRIAALKVYPVLLLDAVRAMLTMQPIGIRHLSWEYTRIGWGAAFTAATLCLALLAIAVVLRKTAPLVLAAALTTGLMLTPIALVASVPGWGGFGRYLYVPLAITSLALGELGLAAHRGLAEHRPPLRWAALAIVATGLIVEMTGIQRALWVYANQENLARAAIEIFPDGPDGWEWLGNVHIDRGDLEAARECYLKATERGPELFRPRHNLAAALYYTGRPAEALAQLEILDSLHPPTAPGSKVAILALMDLGRWDEAVDRLVNALDRNPKNEGLIGVAAQLVDVHPQPEVLGRQMAAVLAQPEHAAAAEVVGPMLDLASD